jgi:hypothetical protein
MRDFCWIARFAMPAALSIWNRVFWYITANILVGTDVSEQLDAFVFRVGPSDIVFQRSNLVLA